MWWQIFIVWIFGFLAGIIVAVEVKDRKIKKRNNG